MRKISVWLVLTFICTSFALAQDKTIAVSGRVVETESKEPVTQATVRLLALPDSSYVAGIATGNKGGFTLPKVKAGKYLFSGFFHRFPYKNTLVAALYRCAR